MTKYPGRRVFQRFIGFLLGANMKLPVTRICPNPARTNIIAVSLLEGKVDCAR